MKDYSENIERIHDNVRRWFARGLYYLMTTTPKKDRAKQIASDSGLSKSVISQVFNFKIDSKGVTRSLGQESQELIAYNSFGLHIDDLIRIGREIENGIKPKIPVANIEEICENFIRPIIKDLKAIGEMSPATLESLGAHIRFERKQIEGKLGKSPPNKALGG